MRRTVAIAVPRHPCGADRRIVRPYGTIVIRHRVVACLAVSQRAHAPAVVERRAFELLDHRVRAFRRRDAAVEQMPRIRGADATKLPSPIDRDSVIRMFRHPESMLD